VHELQTIEHVARFQHGEELEDLVMKRPNFDLSPAESGPAPGAFAEELQGTPRAAQAIGIRVLSE